MENHTIAKALGNEVTINMPLQKIDKEQRLVSGWATLDNPDLQDDVVLKEASEGAFSRFRGNIREMHDKIAAGRMVSWTSDTYFDPETKKNYNGVYVTAYISKGAQSTWEKVLDGTLSAFSIKGPIRDSEYEFSKDSGKNLRVIKAYDLEELSLVDSGGNQLANVVSFQKVNDSDDVLIKGAVVDIKLESVFYCTEDGIAKTSASDSVTCGRCNNAMTNIGWVESNYDDVAEKVSGLVKSYTSQNSNTTTTITINGNGAFTSAGTLTTGGTPTVVVKGGETVTEQNNEVVENVEETDTEVETSEAPTTVVEDEKVEPVNEAESVEDDLKKMISELSESVREGLKKSEETVEERYATLEKRLDDLKSDLETRIDEHAKRGDDLAEKFNSLHGSLDSLLEKVGSIEDGTAVKKSGDLGGSTEDTVQKNRTGVWNGTFFSADNL